jgi:hypothetical protein
VNTSSRSTRTAYEEWFRTASDAAVKLFNRYQVDSVDTSTGEDYVKNLISLFHKR